MLTKVTKEVWGGRVSLGGVVDVEKSSMFGKKKTTISLLTSSIVAPKLEARHLLSQAAHIGGGARNVCSCILQQRKARGNLAA
jgi:hypothetical protein